MFLFGGQRSLFYKESPSKMPWFFGSNKSSFESWNPLPASTFDAGVIIAGEDGTHFCLWFQDED